MPGFNTYDPKDVVVSVAGTIITGFAEDSQVRIERAEDSWGDVSGADGEVARWATNDRRGEVTVSLMQTSISNLFLSNKINADELEADGVFELVIQDTRGNDLHSSGSAWIKKPAAASYRKGIETREWVIRCADLNTIIGGHGTL